MKLAYRRLAIVLLGIIISSPALAQMTTYFGKNKIRYDTFEWMIYETPHFRISYYDRVEPSLEKIASFAESAYDDLARALNYQVLEPIPLIVYATHAEFEQTNAIVNFIPEGIGAFATPVRNRMFLPVDLPESELQALIRHELTHIFQYEILFQGRRGRAIYRRPPLWFMEGLASYLGNDENSRDKAYMRDAAMAGFVPSVASGVSGYFAYRYGHKVFDFIADEWGEDGLRDFVMAFRNALGGRINRPFRRVFNLDAEEFDARFRSWLREHYMDYRDRGLPEEFGRRFRTKSNIGSIELSPAGAPSGDLIAAFSTYKGQVDVVTFGVPDRRLYRNLTKGFTNDYQYLVAQQLTVGGDHGGDLAFSPDGNQVAVFARTERLRVLLLLDAIKGGIDREIVIPLPLDQCMQPAFSPDGRAVAFRAFSEGKCDIFQVDLVSEEISNLTNDDAYDAAPTYTPDGSNLVYTTKTGGWGKLVQISLADPSQRQQLTFGPGDDEGAAFSSDGKRLYFASDREKEVFDIYAMDLETRRLTRLTHIIGAALNPVPVSTLEGERVVFQGLSRNSWELYVADPNLGEPAGIAEPPQEFIDLEPYIPSVSVTFESDKAEPLGRRKYFLEDATAYVGIDQYSNLLSQAYITFADQYGDRRFWALLNSVDTFSNFRLGFMNLEPRLQWGVTIFDNRSFYLFGYDPNLNRYQDREQTYRVTGAMANAQYPFSLYHRVEGSVGYIDRSIGYPTAGEEGRLDFVYDKSQSPLISLGLVGDTVEYARHGPHAGSRWRATLSYMADMDGGGALSQQVVIDGRKYIPISRRNEIAGRIYIAAADGNRPSIFAFGGLDTVRGQRTQSVSGNRAAFVNLEWRFPLIDRLDFPFLHLEEIRGRAFIDVGAAWYDVDGLKYDHYGGNPNNVDNDQYFKFMRDGRLEDGVAAAGFGLSVRLLGMPMHWDFVRRWDFKEFSSTEVDFWIGIRF